MKIEKCNSSQRFKGRSTVSLMFGHDKTKKISEDKNKDIWNPPSIKRGSSISLKVGHDINKEDENKDIWYHSTIKSMVVMM